MRDALGHVQSILVLGGTSEIGLATTLALAPGRARKVVLTARDPAGTTAAVDRLHNAGVDDVSVVPFDAIDTASHAKIIESIFTQHGDIDLVLLAFGVLGDQHEFDHDPEAAAQAAIVNYAGAVSSGLAVAEQFRRQGHGTLVVLSSVAAERPRKSNYVYGSSKAGLDAFAQGLGDALIGSGARVMIVRPGFVHTRMTAHLPPQPLSTTPEAVAAVIVRGLERGDEIVWAPAPLRYLFAVMRHLPRGLWRIVSAR
jgi:decaprenylphospho-beta-D-erythro-pentofuranosid-2-ulose 2-reductase